MSRPELDGIVWGTSSYSAGNGACVEVALAPAEVHVRDTKNRTGGALTFDATAWQRFVGAVTPRS